MANGDVEMLCFDKADEMLSRVAFSHFKLLRFHFALAIALASLLFSHCVHRLGLF